MRLGAVATGLAAGLLGLGPGALAAVLQRAPDQAAQAGAGAGAGALRARVFEDDEIEQDHEGLRAPAQPPRASEKYKLTDDLFGKKIRIKDFGYEWAGPVGKPVELSKKMEQWVGKLFGGAKFYERTLYHFGTLVGVFYDCPEYGAFITTQRSTKDFGGMMTWMDFVVNQYKQMNGKLPTYVGEACAEKSYTATQTPEMQLINDACYRNAKQLTESAEGWGDADKLDSAGGQGTGPALAEPGWHGSPGDKLQNKNTVAQELMAPENSNKADVETFAVFGVPKGAAKGHGDLYYTLAKYKWD